MPFNSLTFILFFATILVLYHSLRNWKVQKSILLVGSYLFYAAWNPPFVLLLWLSTVIDWFAAKGIEKSENKGSKRGYLLLSLATNLGLLAFFKYGGFVLDNFKNALGLIGLELQFAAPDIILPVGISFYTFQTLSYTLDVYNGKSRSAESFLDYALYVTFFPQLVAGPIVRSNHFLPQCQNARVTTAHTFGWGLFLLTLGLFQKVVLADGLLAPAADAVFGWRQGPVGTLDAWTGIFAFSGQIFFDFSGYSTCAIGVAMCLGFMLPDNFRSPYAAIGFSDFWRRWHISLSTWIRDYIYIPLGGSRQGKARALTNLFFTMFLVGLWHGAAWHFVLWGILHGFYLVIEHLLRKKYGESERFQRKSWRFALWVITLSIVCLTWIFFRSDSPLYTFLLLLASLGVIPNGAQILPTTQILTVFCIFIPLLITHWKLRDTRLENVYEQAPGWLIALFWTLMLFGIIITQGTGNAFIYFQF